MVSWIFLDGREQDRIHLNLSLTISDRSCVRNSILDEMYRKPYLFRSCEVVGIAVR